MWHALSTYPLYFVATGGQFMRAVVERCQHTGPKAHTLVTMGAQHQGIMNVPECWNPSFNMTPAEPFCWLIQRILGQGAYLSWVQNTIIQAQYFKVKGSLWPSQRTETVWYGSAIMENCLLKYFMGYLCIDKGIADLFEQADICPGWLEKTFMSRKIRP